MIAAHTAELLPELRHLVFRLRAPGCTTPSEEAWRSTMTAGKAEDRALLAEYGQVAQQFRKLTDIRFKLLSLLPLSTIGSLVILEKVKDTELIATPIALFGFFTTIAIFIYNLRNDQHYDELVGRAAHIERQLQLFDGSFAQRPERWHRLLPGIRVEHRWPISLIYSGSAALWLWMVLQPLCESPTAKEVCALVAILFAGSTMGYLAKSRSSSDKRCRRAVDSAMQVLVNTSAQGKALRCAKALVENLDGLGAGHRGYAKQVQRYERRLEFYLDPGKAEQFMPAVPEGELDESTASYVLALTIDLPARWIRDVHSGRR
ncbi:MAG: hypothetical protein QM760_07080 [Nibricoccus sp.]